MPRARVTLCTCLAACLWAAPGRASPAVVPPSPRQQVDAVYPLAEARSELVTVELAVTVEVDGRVGAVDVTRSGGPAFDDAAVAAVKQWRFEPARRGDVAVAAKIRVPFQFAPPVEPAEPPGPTDSPPVPSTSPTPPAPDASPAAPAPGPTQPAPSTTPEQPAPSASPAAPEPVLDVAARSRRPPPRAASDFVVERDVLAAPPRQSAADMLSSAPGVYVARAEGEAVAHEITLRGFNAAHGQDIEITAGSLPLNQVSHLHGQGYADLNWIIPETVRSIRVTEGVYDPRQGDFAVAGSIDFDLAVPRRGIQLRSTGGSFATFRQLVLWAPKGQDDETFAAATVRRTRGFGMNRGGLSGMAMGQFAFAAGGWRGKVHVAAYAARAGLAGVLRRDDVAAGVVGFHDSYGDPSANSQSASAARGHLALDLERRGERGAVTRMAVWTALVDFHSRENFTGYTQRGVVMPEWVGRGDLIEQQNRDFGGGMRLSHRTGAWRPARWFQAALEVGASARIHNVQQAQNLLQAPQNETWDRRVDATVLASDVGMYGDLDLRFGKRVRLRGGGRADVLHYDIDDRLGNFIAPYQIESHLVGHRRTATGVAAGPRASLEVAPVPWVSLFAAYGQGYRSPQARQLDEGERAPFAKVHSTEGGVRMSPWGGRLQLSAAGFATFLSQDLAFDPEEGRLEKVGPTRRAGAAVQLIARPLPWLVAAGSVTYVHAVLRAPPPATAENPSPPYVPGQLLPYVPPVVVRADVGVDKDLVELKGRPLGLRVGLGYSYLSPRPLPYGQFADPVHLLDASAAVRWSVVEVGVEAFNLLARRWAATEYNFVSDWGTRPVPSLLPARHFAAGPPLSVMGTLALHF
ncbi:TonB-dependent receptor domain-containing protein [Nannocystis pusilla]|uniref:TonB-dependent receptor n=1 Tax=Nannocystis pusilla TaxID=889268 RepID=A0ABS7TTK6_9BACT|nr:TonB-dependent receptor [Nannocystis pusilla]